MGFFLSFLIIGLSFPVKTVSHEGPKTSIESYIRSLHTIQASLVQLLPIEDCFGIEQDLTVECASKEHSCLGQCGLHSIEADGLKTCSCDQFCELFKDCCGDFSFVCPHLVDESKRLSTKFQPEFIKCTHGYFNVVSCPLEWNADGNFSQPLDKLIWGGTNSYNFVTDSRTGLTFQNAHIAVCNGKDIRDLQLWKTLEGKPRNMRARLCHTESRMSCSKNFKNTRPRCNFKEIILAMRTACRLYASKNTRERFKDYMLNNILADDHELYNQYTFPALARMYRTFCSFSTTPIHSFTSSILKNFSNLINLSALDIFTVEFGPVIFTNWCRFKSGNNCVKLCKGNELLVENVCKEITLIEVRFYLPSFANNCDVHHYLNIIIYQMARMALFLKFFDTEIWHEGRTAIVRFEVDHPLACTEMKDPYLRSVLRRIQRYNYDALGMDLNFSLHTIIACPRVGDYKLCKALDFFPFGLKTNNSNNKYNNQYNNNNNGDNRQYNMLGDKDDSNETRVESESNPSEGPTRIKRSSLIPNTPKPTSDTSCSPTTMSRTQSVGTQTESPQDPRPFQKRDPPPIDPISPVPCCECVKYHQSTVREMYINDKLCVSFGYFPRNLTVRFLSRFHDFEQLTWILATIDATLNLCGSRPLANKNKPTGSLRQGSWITKTNSGKSHSNYNCVHILGLVATLVWYIQQV